MVYYGILTCDDDIPLGKEKPQRVIRTHANPP